MAKIESDWDSVKDIKEGQGMNWTLLSKFRDLNEKEFQEKVMPLSMSEDRARKLAEEWTKENAGNHGLGPFYSAIPLH